MSEFTKNLEAKIDALLNAGKEPFDAFYDKHKGDIAEPGYVWVVLNHGDQYAPEAGFVHSVHATLPLALRASETILTDDLTIQTHPNVVDVLAGDYWVQITREEVQYDTIVPT